MNFTRAGVIKFRPNEKLLKVQRRHWFLIFVEALVMGLVVIIPPILYSLGFKFFPKLEEIVLSYNPDSFLSFSYLIYLLVVWIAFFVLWTDYYLDVWYVTNERIIAVEQKGLFWREIIDLRYEKVQDVTVEISGIISTLLDFGDLHVQTAGVGREIILRKAAKPDEAKRIILYEHSKTLEKHQQEPAGEP